MAGDAEKSQTTISNSQLMSDSYMDPDLLNALAALERNSHSFEDMAALLDDNANLTTNTGGGVLLPPSETQIIGPATTKTTNTSISQQIKTEPTDDYLNTPCCLGAGGQTTADMMYGSGTDTVPQLPFVTYPGTTHAMLQGLPQHPTVKTEPPTVQPSCPGSAPRKARKVKGVNGDEKKERRKAQNRKAAKNYREKQKSKKDLVESDYQRLISENSQKENEISSLNHEVQRLQNILDDHKKNGGCRMPSAVKCPPMTGTLPLTQKDVTSSTVSHIPQPINIPDFALGSETERASQVPPYTPNSEQSFGFETNIYSPQADDKIAGRQEQQVYSPLDGQDFNVDLSPAEAEAFNSLENLGQQSNLLDVNQWQITLDCLR